MEKQKHENFFYVIFVYFKSIQGSFQYFFEKTKTRKLKFWEANHMFPKKRNIYSRVNGHAINKW